MSLQDKINNLKQYVMRPTSFIIYNVPYDGKNRNFMFHDFQETISGKIPLYNSICDKGHTLVLHQVPT